MRFDFSVDLDPIVSAIGRATPKASHTLAVQVSKDTEKFVPALTGSLADRTRVDGGIITYPGPYAHYLYVGKLMVDPRTGSPWASTGANKIYASPEKELDIKKTTHGQAQSHWFEVSKALNMDRWNDIFKKAVDRELG